MSDRIDLIYDMVCRLVAKADAADARMDQIEKDNLDTKSRQGLKGLIATTIPGSVAIVVLVVAWLLKG